MKVLDILRLYEMEQFNYKQIGAHADVGKSTVGDVLKRCKEAGIDYQKALAMTTADLKHGSIIPVYQEQYQTWYGR